MPAGGGRSIFALPWLGRTLLGTTDNDYEGDARDAPRAARARRTSTTCSTPTNDYFGTSLAAGDLTGAYAGVRPLISTGDPKKSVDISRKAELYETSSGMVTITGGKLTTWRRMAKMAVDRLVEREARDAPCRTHEIPLGATVAPGDLPRVEGVPEDAYARARRPLRPRRPRRPRASRASAPSSPSRSSPGLPDLLAEVVYAARREQARSLGDVLLRRTRLGLLAGRERRCRRATPRGASRDALAPRARLGRRPRSRRSSRRGARRRLPKASSAAA